MFFIYFFFISATLIVLPLISIVITLHIYMSPKKMY